MEQKKLKEEAHSCRDASAIKIFFRLILISFFEKKILNKNLLHFSNVLKMPIFQIP
jgi:hypothetical protein